MHIYYHIEKWRFCFTHDPKTFDVGPDGLRSTTVPRNSKYDDIHINSHKYVNTTMT
jgi:hypothetical protein